MVSVEQPYHKEHDNRKPVDEVKKFKTKIAWDVIKKEGKQQLEIE